MAETVEILGQRVSRMATSLDITQVDEVVELTPDIGRLLRLEKLRIESSNVVGTLPTELGLLVGLTELRITNTGLHGEIPTELGSLEALTVLDIQQNGFETKLPSELGRIVGLKQLSVQDNGLTGEIPSQLGKLVELRTLDVYNSFFESSLPSQLGHLQKLKTFRAASSKLRGLLPTELGRVTSLANLQFHFNDLSGRLPSQLGNLVLLENFFVSFNQLDGKLPTEIGRLQAIRELSVNDNRLTGPIPSELGEYQRVNILDLQSNQFTGNLPTELGRLDMMRYFLPHNNRLGGSIPSELWNMKELVWLELAGNRFTSSIPPEISNLKHLSVLNLRSNLLHGEIPSEIGTLKKLTDLDVKGSGFEGDIPRELSSLPILNRLDLSENRFSARMPTEMGLLDSLRRFYASDSNITGPIPTELAQMPRLRALHLDQNKLTGRIPSGLGLLDLKLELRLDFNLLHGEVPTEIGALRNVKTVALNDNLLQGVLPSELGQLDSLVEIFLARNDFKFFCDCELLSWYPSMIEQVVNQDANDLALCTDANEYSGMYPHLLRSDPEAPCHNPTINAKLTESLATSIGLAWEFRTDKSHPSIAFRVELGDDSAAFQRCRGFLVNGEKHGTGFVALAFELNWGEGVRCIWAMEGSAGGENYRFWIENLKPFFDYEFTVRAIYVYFGEHGSNVRYVFGARSSRFDVRTGESAPEGSPTNISVSHRGSNEIDLDWLDPSVSNGIIVETQGEVYHRNSTIAHHVFATSLNSESLRGMFEASESYSIRLRARTRSSGFGNWSKDVVVQTCPANTRTFGEDECLAEIGFFLNNNKRAVSCEVLPLWSITDPLCSQAALDVSKLNLSAGVWRESLESIKLTRCPNPEYCQRMHVNTSVQDPNDYCADNHVGIYCEGCADGYIISAAGCIVCNESHTQIAMLVLGLLTIVLLGSLLILMVYISAVNFKIRRIVRSQQDETDDASADGSSKTLSRGQYYFETMKTKLRIFTGFLQLIFAYQTLLATEAVGMPGFLLDGFGFMTSLSFKHLSSTLSMHCWLPLKDHYWHLYAYSLTPLFFVLFLYGLRIVSAKLFKSLKGVIEYELLSAALFVLFLVYPGVSQTIFATFWCEEFPEADGDVVYKTALAVDYTTSCEPSDERLVAQVFAGVMIAVYPIGVVVLYVWFLRKYKLSQQDTNQQREIEDRRIKFLVYPYRREMYWFEAYELVRKIVQTSILGFIRYYGSGDILFLNMLAQNLNVAAIIILVYLQPYKRDGDFAYAVISLFLLIPVIQLALANATRGDEQVAQAGITLIILINFALVFVASVCEVVCARYMKQSAGSVRSSFTDSATKEA